MAHRDWDKVRRERNLRRESYVDTVPPSRVPAPRQKGPARTPKLQKKLRCPHCGKRFEFDWKVRVHLFGKHQERR